MSFHVYLANIHAKTGKPSEDFKKLVFEKEFYQSGEIVQGVKTSAIADWLKRNFELGHGYAMAIYAMWKWKKE